VKVWLNLTAIVLLAIGSTQASLAKEPRAHRARHGAGAIAKSATPIDAHPHNAIEEHIAASPPAPDGVPEKIRRPDASPKLGARGNLQPRRIPLPASSSPPVRNAIGVPVVPRSDERLSSHPALQNPAAVGSGARSPINPGNGVGGAKTVHPNPTPLPAASAANQGKIGGTGLIRPASAPAALGGPAKPAGGINGTTFRQKH
jgi:hypothetical protein